MKRKMLKAKEVKRTLSYEIAISKKDKVELVEDKIILINGKPSFFYYEKKLLPTLNYLQSNDVGLKKITVDMGAVKFLVKGADLMRPGITTIDEGILKDDIVIIIDETHAKPIALGKTLYNTEEMQALEKGKVIENIHYVGDEIWKTT